MIAIIIINYRGKIVSVSVTSRLSSNNKKRIMVVDDEYDITFTLQAGLEDGGFGVDAFTDPELALSSYKPGLYDLVTY